jgi:hypothetical protein
MNGFISKEKYMRERCSEMLGEYYYIDILRERLKNHQDWIRDVHIYKRCMNIYKKVEVEMFKEKPIIYLFNFFYFLPIKMLKFFKNIKNEYFYIRVVKEIEIIQKEIEDIKKNSATQLTFGKK